MNNKAILGIIRPSFLWNDPTNPTKVQKIPYFFVGFPNKNSSNKKQNKQKLMR